MVFISGTRTHFQRGGATTSESPRHEARACNEKASNFHVQEAQVKVCVDTYRKDLTPKIPCDGFWTKLCKFWI